jgi:hypothetical protein
MNPSGGAACCQHGIGSCADGVMPGFNWSSACFKIVASATSADVEPWFPHNWSSRSLAGFDLPLNLSLVTPAATGFEMASNAMANILHHIPAQLMPGHAENQVMTVPARSHRRPRPRKARQNPGTRMRTRMRRIAQT